MDFDTYLKEFLAKRPAISVKALEKAAGLPDTTISQSISGKRKFPEKHKAKLAEASEIYGWDFYETGDTSKNSGKGINIKFQQAIPEPWEDQSINGKRGEVIIPAWLMQNPKENGSDNTPDQ